MHQIQTTIHTLGTALDEAATANPVFLPTREKSQALLALMRLRGRLEELYYRVLAASHDVAEQVGARDVATWLVGQELTDGPPVRAQLELAKALDRREAIREGLAEGSFTVEHAHVMARVLDDLPEHLPREVIASAEQHLCGLATQHRPKDLRGLARHLLHTVAPEIAEEEDAKALQRLEQAAAKKLSLSIKPQGDGTSRVSAVVPEAVGERLRTLLESFAQPRIAALETDATPRPRYRIMAEAFGQLLETIDPGRLPAHGGDATTVVVTIPLAQLRREVGTAELAGTTITAGDITAGEARRLACTATIIPAVLDGNSEPLDLGRARRLFSPTQRKALRIRDQHCRATGCTVPAAWCDSHHLESWTRGGRTDLANAVLLCGHHHRTTHNPNYQTTRLPNGDIEFHRRT